MKSKRNLPFFTLKWKFERKFSENFDVYFPNLHLYVKGQSFAFRTVSSHIWSWGVKGIDCSKKVTESIDDSLSLSFSQPFDFWLFWSKMLRKLLAGKHTFYIVCLQVTSPDSKIPPIRSLRILFEFAFSSQNPNGRYPLQTGCFYSKNRRVNHNSCMFLKIYLWWNRGEWNGIQGWFQLELR